MAKPSVQSSDPPQPAPPEPGAAAAAPKHRGLILLSALVIVIAGAAAYHNSFNGPFIFDDRQSISGNPTIRQLWPIWPALNPPGGGTTVTGRPVVNLSLAIDYAIAGPEPLGYHVGNLIIHLLAALTLFGVARRTFLSPRLRQRFSGAATALALAIGLLWTVHPLHTEAVTYLAQRAEAIVALCYLLTLYGVIRGADSAKPALWYVLAVVACLAGMASKEVMVTAPVLILLYDRLFLADSFAQLLRRRWKPYLALAATWGLLAYLVISTGGRGGTAGMGTKVTPLAYAATQFGAIMQYLRLTFWPDRLVFDYGTGVAEGIREILPYALMVLVLLAATAVTLWGWPRAGFVALAFFVILAPSSSVVPVATQTIAEHRMYLPLAAVIALVVVGAFLFLNRFPLPAGLTGWVSLGVVALLALGLGWRTAVRNTVYAGEVSIWQDTVDKCFDNARAHSNLGYLLVKQGRIDRGLEHLQQAFRLDRDDPEILNNLGYALMRQGELAAAMVNYRRALEIRPEYPEAHYNLGLALARQERLAEATGQFREYVRLAPRSPEGRYFLARTLADQGDAEGAIEQYQQALGLRRIYPEAMIGLARALASKPNAAPEDVARALALAQQLCRMTGNREPHSLDALGMALAAAGRFDEAIAAAQQALDLARGMKPAQPANEIQQRLELYRAGQPYRESPRSPDG